MVLQLLPTEVSPAEIKQPTSRIITPQVLSAFMAAGGDFVEAVGYSLASSNHDSSQSSSRSFHTLYYAREVCLYAMQMPNQLTMERTIVAVRALTSQPYTTLTFYAAVACEVLARKIVHASPRDRLAHIMSTRYKYKEDNAEFEDMSSALELAIDQNWFVPHSWMLNS